MEIPKRRIRDKMPVMKGIGGFRFRAPVGIALLALAGAAPPSGLSQAEPGLWEITRSGAAPVRLCIATPAVLAQFEHRSGKCTRDLIRDNSLAATIHYSCSGGDFGQSDVTVLTPRSLRIRTQGISGGAPFDYTFQARRVGDCAGH